MEKNKDLENIKQTALMAEQREKWLAGMVETIEDRESIIDGLTYIVKIYHTYLINAARIIEEFEQAAEKKVVNKNRMLGDSYFCKTEK